MTRQEILMSVRQFVAGHFIIAPGKTLADDESLLGSGVLDSIGFMTLITHLEKQFQIGFLDTELGAENVDSISRLADFISKKLP